MSLVELVSANQAPLLAREYFSTDEPSPLVAALAHVPEFLETAWPFIGSVFGPSSLPDRLKEIVVLRASSRNACRYCIALHTLEARGAGLTVAEIAALRDDPAAIATFSAPEKATIAFTDALCERPEGAVKHLGAHFDDSQIVELTLLGAATIMLNRFAVALALPPTGETVRRLKQEGLPVG